MVEFLLSYEQRKEAARALDRAADALERANEICRQILADMDKKEAA